MQSQNTDDIEDLQNKNDVFLMGNEKDKLNFRYINFLKNYKIWVYMAVIVLIILIIVIII